MYFAGELIESSIKFVLLGYLYKSFFVFCFFCFIFFTLLSKFKVVLECRHSCNTDLARLLLFITEGNGGKPDSLTWPLYIQTYKMTVVADLHIIDYCPWLGLHFLAFNDLFIKFK